MRAAGRIERVESKYNGTKIALHLYSGRKRKLERFLQNLLGKSVTVDIDDGRSLDANGRYWELVSKVVVASGMSKTEVHNRALAEYGQHTGEYVTLRDGIDWRKLRYSHLDPQVDEDGNEIYEVVRGSSTYNTKEMSALIDGIIEIAKEWGIDTRTPDEVARDAIREQK